MPSSDIHVAESKQRIEALLNFLPPITLSEMAGIRLMNRTDQKYVTNVNVLLELLTKVRGYYFVQEIDGQRISRYATTYWDDLSHHMYRQHQTGHRPRQKVRVRTYVGAGLSFLEIKNKDNHGKTFKNRIKVASVQDVVNNHAGQDFLTQQTGLTFADIEPQISNNFFRVTLVNYEKTERLTIDFGLSFFNHATQDHEAMPDVVIIELKRDGRKYSPILPLLRQLRIKPYGFSKYCIGQTVTDHSLHPGIFKKRLVKIKKAATKVALSL